MTDTQLIPAGRAGAALATFVPTNMDEVKRMAQWAAVGGMAPKSLTEGKNVEQATAACAIAIMAGAELGLTPMMSLRSYAVVNGRPTLWGDGLIAVVMKSPLYKAGSLQRGYDDAKKLGWCVAERTDGTKWREEFTEAQAKKAGLLNKKGPWQEYPDVMMTRRAISKCLNFLFADVLGGFVTEDEAYYSYETVDVTPRQVAVADAPEIPEAETTTSATSTEAAKVIEPETADDTNDDDSGVVEQTPQSIMDNLKHWLEQAKDAETIESTWSELDIESEFSSDEARMAEAIALKDKHLLRVGGQRDLLGDAPEIE
jgi:hypothetical protein